MLRGVGGCSGIGGKDFSTWLERAQAISFITLFQILVFWNAANIVNDRFQPPPIRVTSYCLGLKLSQEHSDGQSQFLENIEMLRDSKSGCARMKEGEGEQKRSPWRWARGKSKGREGQTIQKKRNIPPILFIVN